MAFNFEDPGTSGTTQQEQQTQTSAEQGTTASTEATQAADANIKGLSEAEIQNPDAIIVTVSDPKTPVIVLFGARTSGKTMTLIRLTKYLEGMGYNVVPDPIFRPDRDTHYQRMCNEFGTLAHSDYAAVGNDVMSFMLVKVISPSGRTLCQILEAPGEHYFDADIPDRTFPAYIEKICRSIPNRPKDKIIFTCHKVDRSAHFRPDGRPDVPQIFQNIKNQYPHIFDRYANRNPITRWFWPYNFDFVTFSAGTFNPTGDGRQVYTPGEDFYPEQLWNVIKKNI